MPRINVALKDNKIVTIDEVERGLDCGCVCIYCHSRLVARKGDEREHHFAHYDECETMDCYEYAFRESTKKALLISSEIIVPLNEEKTHTFKYNSVEIIDSKKNYHNGLEILVELKNENGHTLDVLICTANNKSINRVDNKNYREGISRIRVNLINVQALNFEEFRRYLANDILSKEWIYNKKLEEVKKSLENKKENSIAVNEDESVENRIAITPRFYKKNNVVRNLGNKRNNNVIGDKIRKDMEITYQERGISENLPRGMCPYCTNSLKLYDANELEVLRCPICSFKAEVNKSDNTIKFRKKFGDKSLVVLPIPKKFLV